MFSGCGKSTIRPASRSCFRASLCAKHDKSRSRAECSYKGPTRPLDRLGLPNEAGRVRAKRFESCPHRNTRPRKFAFTASPAGSTERNASSTRERDAPTAGRRTRPLAGNGVFTGQYPPMTSGIPNGRRSTTAKCEFGRTSKRRRMAARRSRVWREGLGPELIQPEIDSVKSRFVDLIDPFRPVWRDGNKVGIEQGLEMLRNRRATDR